MTDTTLLPRLPDRLSVNPHSPHHNQDFLNHAVGIRLNGNEHTYAEMHCITEEGIAVASGKAKDRKGNPLLLKLKGQVEPFYR